MRTLLHQLLRRFAVRTLRAYQPRIIGITGSVGKTSARSAIVCALQGSTDIRTSLGNYNNEFGLPLTILGEASPGRSLFGWMGVLWRGWKLSLGFDKTYPATLVLEYGADKKGDIAYLTSMARPSIAVVTAVGRAHTEAIGTIEDVQEEKGMLIRALPADGIAVLNSDDERVARMRQMAHGAVVTYGLSDQADITLAAARLETYHDGDILPGERVSRLVCTVKVGADQADTVLHNILGDAHVRALLAGVAVACQLGVPLSKAAKGLEAYTPPPGRMRLIGGIKHSLIMDDSYNASPEAVHAALETLGSMPLTSPSQRLVALGDMLELGRYSQSAHREVGAHAAQLPLDLLVCVGEQSREIARGALEAGMAQERIFTYAHAAEAARFIQSRMKRGDVLLVKGSQGVRMERVVKELMAEPLRAEQLLCRQSARWLATP